MNVTVELHVVAMTDEEAGHWCDSCQLPSAIHQVFEVWIGDGPGPGALRTLSYCTDCESTRWED